MADVVEVNVHTWESRETLELIETRLLDRELINQTHANGLLSNLTYDDKIQEIAREYGSTN